MLENKFIHSGATGDIVFSLPVIRDMGGGTLYITNFDKQRSESIKKLIEIQSYIKEVIITDEPVEGINLNKFRDFASHHVNLVEAHYFGQNMSTSGWWKRGWLTLDWHKFCENYKPIKTFDHPYCIINRTSNYADPRCDWAKELEYLHELAGDVYFIGYETEYEAFVNKFGYVKYIDCDFLTAAYLMRDAQMVSVCYSAMATIAQGLGINYRLEQAPGHTCSTFFVERETIINP